MSIYLDAAATTKVKPQVVEAMMPYFTDKFHNPSALYSNANKIKEDITKSRETVGSFINADGSEIFFTSSGSEANNWAIQGFANYWSNKGRCVSVITSTIEHKSIISCVDYFDGVDVHYIDVDNEGFIDMKALRDILFYTTQMMENETLVSIQYANNEIGTIQNIKEITKLCHRYGALFHVDAVQALGQIPIDVKELDVDMLSASGHKIGAPKGIGFLYKKNFVQINPLIYGSQMDGLRGGTENIAYIIGMAKAVELIQKDYQNQIKLSVLRNNFINELKALGCKINGSLSERLPNNINATFSQNITGEALVYLLDMCGIMVATGSACNSHEIKPSYVLKAIGLSDEEVAKTLRFTLSEDITMEEIDNVVCELKKQIQLLEA